MSALRYWLAGPDDQGRTDWIKRFAPAWWTVNFPRPMMAAATNPAPGTLHCDLAFLRRGDLAGLIWTSDDTAGHPLLKPAAVRDYRGLLWRFRWRSGPGLMALNAPNGPTLTLEGRDADGTPRTWYVRLWNFAVGTPVDAVVTLDFDALAAGYAPGGEAVWTGDLDRLSLSLVPDTYDGSDAPLPATLETWVELSAMSVDGPGSTIAVGDAWLPEHGVRIASGYDDSYNVTPERLAREWEALGYRGVVNHYLGESHAAALRWDAAAERYLVDPARTLNAPALAWHRALAGALAAKRMSLGMSVSYELFGDYAPDAWVQRDADGGRAATGYTPPSTLLSPCSGDAMAWLRAVMTALAGVLRGAALPVDVQVGEPWWWVGVDGKLCAYDAATVTAYLAETGLSVPVMRDVLGERSAAERAYLDWLGGKLAGSTAAMAAAAGPGATRRLLVYTPQVLDAARPDLRRANLPSGWAWPAWDRLQLEDYGDVQAGDAGATAKAVAAASAALAYPASAQDYFSGFVADAADALAVWSRVIAALNASRSRGVADVFVWAWPQVARDGLTLFDLGEEDTVAFHDVNFPLALGARAGGGPSFATTVTTAASGYEQRNQAWAQARMHFDAGPGIRSDADLAALIAFFRARRGAAYGFRFRDPLDCTSAAFGAGVTAMDQMLGTGDGVATAFPLAKAYAADGEPRRITRPVAGSVRVAVGGTELAGGWAVADDGVVRFDIGPVAGAAVTAGFLFDVPVRFAEDTLRVAGFAAGAGEVPSVPLIEVREA